VVDEKKRDTRGSRAGVCSTPRGGEEKEKPAQWMRAVTDEGIQGTEPTTGRKLKKEAPPGLKK